LAMQFDDSLKDFSVTRVHASHATHHVGWCA
jgi:hypothetical protein